LRNRVIRERDPKLALDSVLALDRMVLEISMRIYRIPHRDKLRIRTQSRRVHIAVRQHRPRFPWPSHVGIFQGR